MARNNVSGWSADTGARSRAEQMARDLSRDRDDKAKRMYPTTPGPVQAKPKPRPSVRPDASLLLQRKQQHAASTGGSGSTRGSILGSVYRLNAVASGGRAVRTLQAFNGPRGDRTVLGL